jgi:hypothetical protein
VVDGWMVFVLNEWVVDWWMLYVLDECNHRIGSEHRSISGLSIKAMDKGGDLLLQPSCPVHL